MLKNGFSKIEIRNKIFINVFCYENGLTFTIHISDHKFENSIDFNLYLMEINQTMCTSKILTDLCFTKHKIKIKNNFAKVVYSVLAVKMY